MSASTYVDVVFDCPPGPKAPQLIEVVDDAGKRIDVGEWIERPDGRWILRILSAPRTTATSGSAKQVLERLYDSEINCSLSSDWDGGWHATIGNQPGGGFVAESWVASLDEAVTWLHQQAHRQFPQSEYSRRFPL